MLSASEERVTAAAEELSFDLVRDPPGDECANDGPANTTAASASQSDATTHDLVDVVTAAPPLGPVESGTGRPVRSSTG